MVYPDFLTWAQNIVTTARQYGTAEMEIERGLQEAFNQGRALGHREGYTEGKDSAWWREQEKAIAGSCMHGVDHRSIYPCVKCISVTKQESH